MKSTHHSEYLKLKSVFLKTAADSFISGKRLKDQWQELNYLNKPDFKLAINEYDVFEQFFLKNEVEILKFPREESLSIDSIYCRDASIATDYGMILCRMGKEGRILEPNAQKKAYIKAGIPILGEITEPGTLEGGDVAWLDKHTLAVGHSYRTNLDGIEQLKAFLEPNGIEVVVAQLPHYKGTTDVFHLMSILSPVDKDLAVVYSPLMPIQFRNELLDRGYRLVEVPDDEFESMGCNVLAVGPGKCLMVAGNPKTEKALIAAGCEVFTYNGDHISVPGGGGPTCLTRPVLRVG